MAYAAEVPNANTIIGFYTEAEVCNDIVWIGTYNHWSTNLDDLVRFVPMTGYDNWYVVAVSDTTQSGLTNSQGKMVQLRSDGTFSWDYQAGDDLTLVRGTATIIPGYSDEVLIQDIGMNSPVVFASGMWKIGRTPCLHDTIYYTSSDGQVVTPYAPNAFGDAHIVSNTYEGGQGRIVFDKTVTSIGDHAFYYCENLTSIIIPNTIKVIANYAFSVCISLDHIIIPSSVDSLGSKVFEVCRDLTSVVIGSGVRHLGDEPFCHCSSLASLIVDPDNSTYDSRNHCNAIIETATNTLLVGCKNSIIPNDISAIGNMAFFGRSSNCISLPNTITYIGDYAFAQCYEAKSIICHCVIPPMMGADVFVLGDYGWPDIPLYVPEKAIPAYQTAFWWNRFDIQPLLVATDSVATDTARLSWMPVDSASMYQLRIYSEQIGLDTTLYIAADSTNGGISKILAPTQRRAHRVTMDAGGSVIIITIEPNSGTTTTTPFVVTVSTPSTEKVDIQFEMTVLQGTNILREESGSFTLNKDNLTGLESVFYPTQFDSQRCYDIYGHSYHKPQWNSLPTGIYVIRDGGTTMKVLKTQ